MVGVKVEVLVLENLDIASKAAILQGLKDHF
jgi:hypothetical protein